MLFNVFLRREYYALSLIGVTGSHNRTKYSRLCLRTITTIFQPKDADDFHQSENIHAHAVMKSLPLYQNTLIQLSPENKPLLPLLPGLDRAVGTFHPSVKTFIESSLSSDCKSLSNEMYGDMTDNLVRYSSSITDEELINVLYHMKFYPKCDTVKDVGFANLWATLDKECVSRAPRWNLNFLLVIDDLWYGCNLSRLTLFHWTVVKKLFRKCEKLTKEQFVRFMFCLNLSRSIPYSINSYDLEYKLYSIVDELTADEVVIIAMGFFKTETPLRDAELLDKLLQRVIPESVNLDAISVSAIAKVARLSSSRKSIDTLYGFQEIFVPEIDRLSLTACTHLALVGTKSQIPHKKLVKKVVDKVEANVSLARLKELERISLAMTMFNIDCDSLCHKIVQQLRSPERQEEIIQYGRCLPAILHYLTIREIFPLDLIEKVLSPEFIGKYYGRNKSEYKRELLSLDVSTEIEQNFYSGQKLDDKTRDYLLKHNTLRLKPLSKEKISEYQSIFWKVVQATEKLCGGPEYTYLCSILPQNHSAEVIFCTDDKNQFVKVPASIKNKLEHELKFIPEGPEYENVQFHAIYICSRNSCVHNSTEILGRVNMQLRQLQKIGYTVHLIYASQWQEMKNSEAQHNYLKQTIFGTYRSYTNTLDYFSTSRI